MHHLQWRMGGKCLIFKVFRINRIGLTFLGSFMNRGGRVSLLRPGFLSKPREASQALCCSSHRFLLRFVSEMKLGVGKHVSFWLNCPRN